MVSRSLALLLLSRFALGAVTPTAPGPGEVFTAGSMCSISWTPDESGKWKGFSIDLMSGSNSNMTLVTNIAEDLDGTDPSLSPYTWTCPDVDPYSTIYFYQFTAAADKSNPAWTTRFAIASSAGETAAPSHSKQPNGDSVPWGIGVMRSESSMTSREKHYTGTSTEEDGSDESYSGDDGEARQRSSNSKTKGGTDSDEETLTTGTSTRKGGNTSIGTSSEDSEDPEVSEDDETSSSPKSASLKPTLKNTEEDLDATDSNSGTQGSDGSLTGTKDEESEFENPVSTSSRLKTVHSKPTSTPLAINNANAATPILPLPSTSLSSAQPVGCTGGTNATSSYCSPSNSPNYAAHVSKLDSRAVFVAILLCSFGLL